MAFLVDFVASLFVLPHALLLDVLGLATRPLVLVHYLSQHKALSPFTKGTLVLGFLSTGTLALLSLSISKLCGPRTMDWLYRLCATFYLADGLLQLPQLVFPSSTGDAWPLAYAATKTGLLAIVEVLIGLEIMACKGMVGRLLNQDWFWALKLIVHLHLAACSRFVADTLYPTSGVFRHVFLFLAALNLYFALVPKFINNAVWPAIKKAFELLARCVRQAATVAYDLLGGRLFPAIARLFWRLLEHPAIAALQARLVGPLWRLISPWLLPLATACIAASSCDSATHSAKQLAASFSADSALLLLGQAVCAGAATVSKGILTLHAASRLRGLLGWPLLAPLEARPMAAGLWRLAQGLALPWTLAARGSRLATRVFEAVWLGPVAGAFTLAEKQPLLARPFVLGCSGFVYYVCFASATAPCCWLPRAPRAPRCSALRGPCFEARLPVSVCCK